MDLLRFGSVRLHHGKRFVYPWCGSRLGGPGRREAGTNLYDSREHREHRFEQLGLDEVRRAVDSGWSVRHMSSAMSYDSWLTKAYRYATVHPSNGLSTR